MEHPPSFQKTFEGAKEKTERAVHEAQRGVRGATEQLETGIKQLPGGQTTATIFSRSYELCRNVMANAKSTLTAFVRKYPFIGGFLTMWTFFSLIPLGLFMLATVGSLLTTAAIATAIVFTINAGVFTVSSFALGIALFCTFIAASIAYFWFIVAGVTKAAASRLISGVQSGTRRIASSVDEGQYIGSGKEE